MIDDDDDDYFVMGFSGDEKGETMMNIKMKQKEDICKFPF